MRRSPTIRLSPRSRSSRSRSPTWLRSPPSSSSCPSASVTNGTAPVRRPPRPVGRWTGRWTRCVPGSAEVRSATRPSCSVKRVASPMSSENWPKQIATLPGEEGNEIGNRPGVQGHPPPVDLLSLRWWRNERISGYVRAGGAGTGIAERGGWRASRALRQPRPRDGGTERASVLVLRPRRRWTSQW